jgi:hypothetical protein
VNMAPQELRSEAQEKGVYRQLRSGRGLEGRPKGAQGYFGTLESSKIVHQGRPFTVAIISATYKRNHFTF